MFSALRYYLHEAEIIKTGLPVMTAPQLSVDTVSKSVSDTTVQQKAQSVNTVISENTENNTEKIQSTKTNGCNPSLRITAVLYYFNHIQFSFLNFLDF